MHRNASTSCRRSRAAESSSRYHRRMSTQGSVEYRREGAVAHVTFQRPEARNAMTWTMYEQLADTCARIQGDAEVRAAVFRGAGGKAFVAGTDIAQFRDF